ncbi:la RNA binding protein [Novymonas esmeraldas]|uniref:La RNA binding protein n=1 Tax=Novymonas esmeraldas TaxID=1808958 RepID=A0AAW0F4P5_9TRYP
MSDLAEKIRRQVEFYFSDVNIAKDVFLKSKMAEDPEGFVALEVLLTFNRLNSLTKDPKVLADALSGSDTLVMHTEGQSVRRKAALPESIQTDGQTVYVKPVPASATLEELQTFFSAHGTVLAVWRRYFQGGSKDAPVESRTKPSVFVVFSNKEDAEKFAAAPPQHDGVQLSAQMKTAYLDEKAAQVAAKSKGRKRERDDGESAGATSSAAPTRTPAMPANSSYRISGCGDIEKFSEVKGLWPAEEQKGVRYVYMPTKAEALVIFQDAETAEKMVESVKTRAATLQGKQPDVAKLGAEEEKALIESVEKEIAERAAQSGGRGGRGGRGGHRGGRGGHRGGRGGHRGGGRS